MVCSPRSPPSTWSPPAKRRSLTRISGGGVCCGATAERPGKDAPGLLASLPQPLLEYVLSKLSDDWQDHQQQQQSSRDAWPQGGAKYSCTNVRLVSSWLRDAFDAANQRLCLGGGATSSPDAFPIDVQELEAKIFGDAGNKDPFALFLQGGQGAQLTHLASSGMQQDTHNAMPSHGGAGVFGISGPASEGATAMAGALRRLQHLQQQMLHLVRSSPSVASLVLRPHTSWLSAAQVLEACTAPAHTCTVSALPYAISSPSPSPTGACVSPRHAWSSLAHSSLAASPRTVCPTSPRTYTGPAQAIAMACPASSPAYDAPASVCAAFARRRPRLRHLVLSGREDLMSLAPLTTCIMLRHVELADCGAFDDLRPLAACTELRHLDLSGAHAVSDLAPLAGCTALETLLLSSCCAIASLAPLAACVALSCLDLAWCHSLSTLEPLIDCTRLSHLGLAGHGSSTLDDLPLLAQHAPLRSLDLMACEGLEHLGCLAACTALQRLDMPCCYALADLRGLASCASLTHISAAGCGSLESPALAPLATLPRLQHLALPSCTSLTSVAPLAGCSALQRLDISYCRDLKDAAGLAAALPGLQIRQEEPEGQEDMQE